MQAKLEQLAFGLMQALREAGYFRSAWSVKVTDDVIKMVPKLVQKMMGPSDCDTEKYASP